MDYGATTKTPVEPSSVGPVVKDAGTRRDLSSETRLVGYLKVPAIIIYVHFAGLK